VLRRARGSDSKEAHALHERALKPTAAWVEVDDRAPDDLADLRRYYFGGREPPSSSLDVDSGADGDFIVGVENGQIVAMGAIRRVDKANECFGCCYARDGDDRFAAEVKRMRIDPSAQGKGYGRRVLRALIGLAARKGYRWACVETALILTPAVSLYRSSFTHIGWSQYFHLKVIMFHRPLTPADARDDQPPASRSLTPAPSASALALTSLRSAWSVAGALLFGAGLALFSARGEK
jgi:GNAT superfamily N-acetyltransferase